MESGTKKLMSGCVIGCLIVMFIGVVLVFSGYLGVKKMIRKAEETQRVMAQVTEEFGRVSDFVPPPSGVIPGDRIEAFLEVRELSRLEREALETTLAQLTASEESGGENTGNPMDFARSVRAGVGVVPQMVSYTTRRNEAFLEAGMGLGEYLYLYTLIYGSWLEKPISDGPPFVVVGGEVSPERLDDPAVKDRRVAAIRGRLNRTTLPMLRNQLEALTAQTEDGDLGWEESLRTEVMLMAADPGRLPWQDGLPKHTADSLTPYWETLEASYSALCHPVELSVMQN